MSDQTNPKVRVAKLSNLMRRKRQLEDMTLQEVAVQTGVSIATLSRIEKHSKVSGSDSSAIIPDIRTVTTLARWLSIPLNELLDIEDTDTNSSDVDLPLMVDTHLRANRNLKPEDAEVLSKVFRDMYETYLKQGMNNRLVEE
jgi:transcriptional regulator with XRE-family HTH domain